MQPRLSGGVAVRGAVEVAIDYSFAPHKDGAAAAKQIAELDKHLGWPLINKDGVFGKHSGKEQSVTDKIAHN